MIRNRLNLCEVLAPAGSFPALEAAIKAGADAVYLGGHKFGARAYAGNFEPDEMLRAIDYVHLHGKKIYLTINTLFKTEEKQELYDYLYPYYKEGLDAVIVQDIDVAMYIKEQFPDLDLHASTQMTVMGVEGAKFLEELGFTRVVPARELSLEEIAEIRRETNLEIETFVHGALCFSYSGQCLMSSMLGGRSGNRGRCAQPCRLPYDLYDGKKKLNKKEERYLLSPKDLCSIEILPDILRAGTNSLKIEGRMKKPEYVAAVTRQYRKYVDEFLKNERNYQVKPQDMQELMELYNRGGFTKGYYLTHNGRDMMSMKRPNHMGYYVGKIEKIQKNKIIFQAKTDIHKRDILEIKISDDIKVELTSPLDAKKGSTVSLNANQMKKLHPGMEIYRTRNQVLIDEIKDELIHKEKKEKLKGKVSFLVGKPVMMQVYTENFQIMVEGNVVEEAKSQPVTKEQLKIQLEKTGNTPFSLEIEEIVMQGDGFLPMGAIKSLRRKALENIEEEIIGSSRRKAIHLLKETVAGKPQEKRRQIIVSATTLEQARVALDYEKVDAIYLFAEALDFSKWNTFSDEVHKKGKEIYYSMPYIFHKKARDDWKKEKDLLCYGHHDGILVRTFDEFAMLRNFGTYKKRMITDSSLYAYHKGAADFYKEYAGCEVRTILPVELTDQELKGLKEPFADMVIYGYQPLMISAQCQVKNHLGCKKKSGTLYLKDRYQKEFPVHNFCKYCYNVIYNAQPLCLKDAKELDALKIGGLVYRFTIESGKEVKEVLEGHWNQKKYTKGHFKRGIE